MFSEVKKLKAIACNVRLRILNLLIFHKQGLFVCDIVRILEQQQYNISKHLTTLKNADLVIDERVGKSVLYRLNLSEENYEFIEFIKRLNLSKYDVFKNDIKRLKSFLRF